MINLLRPLNCKGTWLATGWTCYTGAHLAVGLVGLATALLLLSVLVLSMLLMVPVCTCTAMGWTRVPPPPPADACCVVSRNAAHQSAVVNAQAHGRADAVILILKTAIVLVFSLESMVPAAVLMLAAIAFGVLALYVYVAYLPFLHAGMNRIHIAYYSAYCWACVCLVMLESRSNPTVRRCIAVLLAITMVPWVYTRVLPAPFPLRQANVEAFVFILGLPSVAFVGYCTGRYYETQPSPVTPTMKSAFGVRVLAPHTRNVPVSITIPVGVCVGGGAG